MHILRLLRNSLLENWFERLVVATFFAGPMMCFLLILRVARLEIRGMAIVLVTFFIAVVVYFGMYCLDNMYIHVEEEEDKDV